MTIRVLVADDDPRFRDALIAMLDRTPSLEVVAAVATGREAISKAVELEPSVAALDIQMPDGGPRAVRGIRAASPRTGIVALTAHEERETVLEMLRAGARAFVLKGSPSDQIVAAIFSVTRGETVLSPRVASVVLSELLASLDRAEQQAEELGALNRTKNELVQILAHELMSPVTVVEGVSSTLTENDSLPADVAEELRESVRRAVARLRRLVRNLSATARLSSDGVELDTVPVAISRIVDEAIAEFADHRGRIRASTSSEDGVAWADPELAMRALALVVENGVQLSEVVEIDVDRVSNALAVKVSDRGPGVPAEFLGRMFEPFTQADMETTRAHQGIGLGLYLARRIMEAHRGTIGAASRPGGGTVVTLSFPEAATEARMPQSADER